MTHRILPLVALLASCSLIGAGNGAAPPTAAPVITFLTTDVRADTGSIELSCEVSSPETLCRWSAAAGGAVLAPPADGLTARFTFVSPAPGDSVLIVGEARLVRRGLVGALAEPFMAWAVRRDEAPGGKPDSVVIVRITLPPVGP